MPTTVSLSIIFKPVFNPLVIPKVSSKGKTAQIHPCFVGSKSLITQPSRSKINRWCRGLGSSQVRHYFSVVTHLWFCMGYFGCWINLPLTPHSHFFNTVAMGIKVVFLASQKSPPWPPLPPCFSVTMRCDGEWCFKTTSTIHFFLLGLRGFPLPVCRHHRFCGDGICWLILIFAFFTCTAFCGSANLGIAKATIPVRPLTA